MVFHVYVDGRCSPPNPLHIVRGSPIEISKPVLVSAKNHYPTDYRRDKPRSVHVVLLFQLSILSTIEMMFGESQRRISGVTRRHQLQGWPGVPPLMATLWPVVSAQNDEASNLQVADFRTNPTDDDDDDNDDGDDGDEMCC